MQFLKRAADARVGEWRKSLASQADWRPGGLEWGIANNLGDLGGGAWQETGAKEMVEELGGVFRSKGFDTWDKVEKIDFRTFHESGLRNRGSVGKLLAGMQGSFYTSAAGKGGTHFYMKRATPDGPLKITSKGFDTSDRQSIIMGLSAAMLPFAVGGLVGAGSTIAAGNATAATWAAAAKGAVSVASTLSAVARDASADPLQSGGVTSRGVAGGANHSAPPGAPSTAPAPAATAGAGVSGETKGGAAGGVTGGGGETEPRILIAGGKSQSWMIPGAVILALGIAALKGRN